MKNKIPIVILLSIVLIIGGVSIIRDPLITSVKTKKLNNKINKEIETKEENNYRNKYRDLKKKYNDLIGWITIEDLDISLPIMAAGDDYYYLDHGYNGEKISSGALFYDEADNTIYGHNMKDGSMFGKLESDWDKIKEIKIDEISEDGSFQTFHYRIKEQYVWDTREESSFNTKNLRLTTCSYSIEQPYGRYSIVLKEI